MAEKEPNSFLAMFGGLDKDVPAEAKVEAVQAPESVAPPVEDKVLATEEGQAEPDTRPIWEKVGFKTPEDLAKSYENIRALETRNNQRLADMDREISFLKGAVSQSAKKPEPERQEPEMTPEQEQEMITTNPRAYREMIKNQAVREAEERILSRPEIRGSIRTVEKVTEDIEKQYTFLPQYREEIRADIARMSPQAVDTLQRDPEAWAQFLEGKANKIAIRLESEERARLKTQADEAKRRQDNENAKAKNISGGQQIIPGTVVGESGKLTETQERIIGMWEANGSMSRFIEGRTKRQ